MSLRKNKKSLSVLCALCGKNLWLRLCLALFFATSFFSLAHWQFVKADPKSEIDVADLGRPAMRVYTEKDGLPQNVITSIAFDKKGYLWAGTQDGAARYNGRIWQAVNMPVRTNSNQIQAVLPDSEGGMWFGTIGGLHRLKDGKWTSFDVKSGLPDNRIWSLLETVNAAGLRSLWAGTQGGGFGAVYRAEHLAMKRFVAVKIFRPAPGNDSAEALERFQLEAVSACRVNHPNAVSILDSGISSEGIAYLVMELLEGRTLASELRRKGTLLIGRAAQILIPVCDLISKAHATGIVHRDIKPENIFLHRSEEGETVKVVDFGIAKLMQASDSLDIKSLTVTGGIIGTPDYIAPERFEGKPYDGRSDVYSLGVVLYETLTGRLPFQCNSGSVWELVRQHLEKEPQPLREINPNIPEEAEAAVLRTLAKDPNKRPTAEELRKELLKLLESAPPMQDENEEESDFSEKLEEKTSPTAGDLHQIEKFLRSLLDAEPDRPDALLTEAGFSDAPTLRMEEKKTKNLLSVEHWKRIEELFYAAVEMAPDKRAAFLDEACCDDPMLRRKIEDLIEADQQNEEY